MAKKGNIRSIRFSDDVLEIIEAQPGENFTAKFEHLIRQCHQELPQREKELTFIRDLIKKENQRLKRTRDLISKIQDEAYRMQRNLEYWNREASNSASRLEKLMDE